MVKFTGRRIAALAGTVVIAASVTTGVLVANAGAGAPEPTHTPALSVVESPTPEPTTIVPAPVAEPVAPAPAPAPVYVAPAPAPAAPSGLAAGSVPPMVPGTDQPDSTACASSTLTWDGTQSVCA